MISKETMNNILDRLNDIARSDDCFEYGLPIHNEPLRALMREAIREEIEKETNIKGDIDG